jgi:hypothetical protein
MIRYFILGTFLIFMAACLNPPNYSEIPAITFDSISSTTARVGHDSITFLIDFTDGDGDLGSSDIPNLFFLDSRTGYTDSFKIPNLTPQGNVKAISGVIAYVGSSFNCIPGKTFDSLYYTIYVQDRAGNKSNQVMTPQIILECQ